jgi:GT2 family glycosyltransferase
MHKTAVVILNWNGIDFLKMFIGTIVKYSTDEDTIVYIADNGSTDGSQDWISSNFPEIKLIKLDKNYGFTGGYNLALKQIKAKYYAVINSDVEVTEGWLKPLIDYLDNNPDAASCQPKILSYHRKGQFEYAGAAGGYIDKYGYPFCRGRIFNRIETDRGQYDTQEDIFWSSGACMLVRESAWQECGGFDTGFFAHMEEIDLCWRFNKAGYRIRYIPESVVYHVGGGALPYESPFKTYLNFRNSLFLLYKNLPDDELHNTLFTRRLLDGVAALKFLLSGSFGSFKSVWKAHMDYYGNLNQLRGQRKEVKLIESNPNSPPILNKSIVFEFYIKRHKTFDSLKM